MTIPFTPFITIYKSTLTLTYCWSGRYNHLSMTFWTLNQYLFTSFSIHTHHTFVEDWEFWDILFNELGVSDFIDIGEGETTEPEDIECGVDAWRARWYAWNSFSCCWMLLHNCWFLTSASSPTHLTSNTSGGSGIESSLSPRTSGRVIKSELWEEGFQAEDFPLIGPIKILCSFFVCEYVDNQIYHG